jgi:hypothetical protein
MSRIPTITITSYVTLAAAATQVVTVTTTPIVSPTTQTLSPITITSGSVAYTSTVPTINNGVATQVAVVVQPQTPFHVYVTDFGGNVYGYFDMSNNPVSASTYNITTIWC